MLFILLTLVIVFEVLSVRNILSSGCFKNGPSGDGASYFFHYIDWKNRKTLNPKRYLLGSSLTSIYPKIYYYYLSIFNTTLLIKHSWLPNYFLKILMILSLSQFANVYLDLGSVQSILLVTCLTILFSEIAVIYPYNFSSTYIFWYPRDDRGKF